MTDSGIIAFHKLSRKLAKSLSSSDTRTDCVSERLSILLHRLEFLMMYLIIVRKSAVGTTGSTSLKSPAKPITLLPIGASHGMRRRSQESKASKALT